MFIAGVKSYMEVSNETSDRLDTETEGSTVRDLESPRALGCSVPSGSEGATKGF